MFYNDTRKQMKMLADKIMSGNRRRNIFVIIAIAMTTFLISTILCIGSGYLKSADKQREMLNGTAADIILTNPTKQQIQALQQNGEIAYMGVSRQIGFIDTTAWPRINSILLRWCDAVEWERHILPAIGNVSGHYPASRSEIMLPVWVLERMGIEHPAIGQTITFSFRYGYTDIHWQPLSEAEDFTFTLCGWYDDYSGNKMYDNAIAYIATDFWSNSVANETNTKSALALTVSDDGGNRILSETEPLNELQEFTDLTKAGNSPSSFSSMTAVMGMIVTIMVCGYLLIYNVLYISVTKDIRMYGQLKTLGATKRQMQRIVYRQVRVLSFWGILLGLTLSVATVFLVVPFGIRALAGDMIMDGAISSSYSPWIFMGAGLFSFITAWMGSRKPSQIAGMVSPIEALRFSEAKASKKNSRKTLHGSQVFKMAAGNVFRNTKGTILVLASLFLGISLFIIVNGILTGLDASHLADEYMEDDIVIEVRGQTNIDDTILALLRKIPDVEEISYTTKLTEQWFMDTGNILEKYIADFCSTGTVPQEAVRQYVDGNKYQTYVFGIGEQDFNEAVSLIKSPLEYEDFCNGEIAFLASATSVPYEGAAVSGEIQLTIMGEIYSMKIAPHYLPATFREDGKTLIAPNIYVSHEWLERIGAAGQINRITLQTGHSEQALNAVTEIFRNIGGMVITSKIEKINELKSSFRGINFLGNAISVILLGIGLMNFVNMMYASVHGRSKELAVLESIGMTKKQICKMLQIEGSIYAGMTGALIFTLGSAVLYGAFQMVKVQASYAVFAYPLLQIVVSVAVVAIICNLVPVLVYKAETSRSIIRRLKTNE